MEEETLDSTSIETAPEPEATKKKRDWLFWYFWFALIAPTLDDILKGYSPQVFVPLMFGNFIFLFLPVYFIVIFVRWLRRGKPEVPSWAAQGFCPMSAGDIQIGDSVLLPKFMTYTVPVLVQTIEVIKQNRDFNLLRFNGQYNYWSQTSMRVKRAINAEPA